MLALTSQFLLPLLSGVLVALIGGAVTLYQVRVIGKRAAARDDYTALWSEVRLRDADADRLRTQVSSLFDQLQTLREENMKLDTELAEARGQVLRLTNQVVRLRADRGENDITEH